MTSPLERTQIIKMLELASRASADLWHSYVAGRDHVSGSNFIATGGDARGSTIELQGASVPDQDLIAHARNWVPEVAGELLRLDSSRWGTGALAPEHVLRGALRVLFQAAVYTRNWACHEDVDRFHGGRLYEELGTP